MTKILELECPGCGRPLSTDMKECPACHRPVVISSLNNVDALSMLEINKYASAYQKALATDPANNKINGALAMCFLKLKLYDKAIAAFDKAIVDNFDNSETYFWAAVAMLKGRKAFVCQRSEIDKAEEFINAAIMIEPKGIYYYYWAYLRYDYYNRKFLRVQPDYKTLVAEACQNNVSNGDINQLFTVLGVEQPEAIRL
ncbi:MAG: tetratricopeptide repeat protein [Bacteroidales bacterium]|nr:tetratricopeptide repeat protein [Bacteroidales bacterium]